MNDPWEEAFATNMGGAIAIHVAPQSIGVDVAAGIELDVDAGMSEDAVYNAVWILTESSEIAAMCQLYARAYKLGLVRTVGDGENDSQVDEAAGDLAADENVQDLVD